MNRPAKLLTAAATVSALAALLLGVGALGGSPLRLAQPGTVGAPSATSDPLARSINNAQRRLKTAPKDWKTWAELGLAYVQQARITVNPQFYPKAVGALETSLRLNGSENYLGMLGEAALQNALHNFRGARAWAQRGIKIDGYNAALYGALADADTQLGRYRDAFSDIDKQNRLLPNVASFTRASYGFELQGKDRFAREALERAATDAVSPADKAFAQYYLGELALNYANDLPSARAYVDAGLAADPTYVPLIQERARIEASQGDSAAALQDYSMVVQAVPQPQYVLEYGELLQSLGRQKDADQQYSLFRTEEKLFTSSGVSLDTEPTLFNADHGTPAAALQAAQKGWKIRPFLEMADAYAWALYRNGRNAEALAYEKKAFATGWNNALFLYHRGMIEVRVKMNAAAKRDLVASLQTNPHFNILQAPIAQQTLRRLQG
jgi:tetratricopeptide (TPR) repeat protein